MRTSLLAALVALLALGAYAFHDLTRIHPTPARVTNGYAPQVGDVVFQSSRSGELAHLIEGTTHSPLSHCGIVGLDRGRWVVIEAVGPVREIPLERWIHRGRQAQLWAYRPAAQLQPYLDAVLHTARTWLGRPYDRRFRMDDERLYCSELVHKAFARATGRTLAEPVTLASLDWRPFEALIRRYEGGPPPLERQLVTPADLARSPLLEPVFTPAAYR